MLLIKVQNPKEDQERRIVLIVVTVSYFNNRVKVTINEKIFTQIHVKVYKYT